MNKVDFYKDLDSSPISTTEINGQLLMAQNNSKNHLCMKGEKWVRYACGSAKPNDPTVVHRGSTDYYEGLFKEECDVVTPLEAIEMDLCTNCKRMLKNQFDLERMVVAVDPDESMGVAVDRFLERLNETFNTDRIQ
jgi:hypothetical protein